MTLRSRLGLALLAITIVLVIPLLVAVLSLQRLHDDTRDLRDREFAASLLVGRMREELYALRTRETALLFLHDVADRDSMAASITTATQLADSLQRYRLAGAASAAHADIDTIAAYAPQEFRLALANSPAADTISSKHIIPALGRAELSVQHAESDLRILTAQRVNDATLAMSQDRAAALIGLIIALVIAGGMAVWLTSSISRPVIALEGGMRAVAEGDLDHQLHMKGSKTDEFGRLAESFQSMTAQLAELDKLKAEFVSVASHELKTPINVIIGYLQLLDEGIYGPLSDQQKDIHHTIEKQAQGLLRLVKQLLDVSRFEAGGGRLELRRIQLASLLDELEQSFHVLAVQKGVKFWIDRGDGLPTDVFWDHDRINEVLGNLVSNALKFTPRGGQVTVVVQGDAGRIQIEVRDTGAGIAADQLPRIFEKFYQADNQRSASIKGSGLGLTIAKQIVEAHGGSIACDSTPGTGTTFTIALPARSERRTSSQQAPVTTTQTVGVR